MSDRYFLDTNILLYTFDKRYPAKRLIGHGLEAGAAFISYQVIQEFYNAMCKRFPAAQFPGTPKHTLRQSFSHCWRLSLR